MATKFTNLDTFLCLLEKGEIDVNATNSQGKSGLRFACQANKKSVCEYILKHPRFDLGFHEQSGFSPTFSAITFGFADVFEVLSKHEGFDPSRLFENKFILMELVIGHGHLRILEILIARWGSSWGVSPETWNDAYGREIRYEQMGYWGGGAEGSENEDEGLKCSFDKRVYLTQKLFTEFRMNPRYVQEKLGGKRDDKHTLWLDMYEALLTCNTRRLGWILNKEESADVDVNMRCRSGPHTGSTLLFIACQMQNRENIYLLHNKYKKILDYMCGNVAYMSPMSFFFNTCTTDVKSWILENLGNCPEAYQVFDSIPQIPTLPSTPALVINVTAAPIVASTPTPDNSLLIQDLESRLKEFEARIKELEQAKTSLEKQLKDEFEHQLIFGSQFREITAKYEEFKKQVLETGEANAKLISKNDQLTDENQQLRASSKPSQTSSERKLTTYPYNSIAVSCGDFDSSKVIGDGACAKVFLGSLKNGAKIAIKKFNNMNFEGALKTFHNEIEFAQRFRGPNILGLMGSAESALEKRYCLIYPYMKNGTLRDRLDLKDGTQPLRWDMRLRILKDVAVALSVIHGHDDGSNSAIHMDVKTDNILLDEHFNACLGDFGLVTNLKERMQILKDVPLQGTPGYLCPEFMKNGTASLKTDIYALGVVMLEMITGRTAVQEGLQSLSTMNLSRLVLSTMKTPAALMNPAFLDPHVQNIWPRDNYQTLAQLARECIDTAPSKRPLTPEIISRLQLLIDQKHRVCLICMDNPVNARLQCGHCVLCMPCADYLQRKGEGCPMCRAEITLIQQGNFSKTYIP